MAPDINRLSFDDFSERSSRRASSASSLSSSPVAQIRIRKICCIGAGYVGGPTCAVIAKEVPFVDVTVADLNPDRIAAWNSQDLPIYEPGLFDVVEAARSSKGRSPNLFFTTDVRKSIADADLIFVAVNTPTKTCGLGAARASDLQYIESAVRMIAEASDSDKIIVEKSTVPCGTAEAIRDILSATAKPGLRFEVLSNPEFLAEGTAMNDLLRPDRVLIGSLNTQSGLAAAAALADIYAEWVPRSRIITMNLWSSELAKLAANALLAQRISSINSLSAICEATGANIDEVSFAVGLDCRIGPKMLKSSVGFGGSCFKKDVLSLVYLAETLNLPEVAAYWKSVVDINEWQKARFTKRIVTSLYNTLVDKKVAVLGFAYKKNTGDTRESAAISIVASLVAERAHVAVYDPQVREAAIWTDLKAACSSSQLLEDNVAVCGTAYDACRDAHAVVIVTEWDEFRSDAAPVADAGSASPTAHVQAQKRLDWRRIAAGMRRPMFVFDGRNIVDAAALTALGFRVESIGDVPLHRRHNDSPAHRLPLVVDQR